MLELLRNTFRFSVFFAQIAGFYAKMLEHEYTSKEIFNKNFFHDWRKEMSEQERKVIKDLKKCGFKEMHKYYEEVQYKGLLLW